MTNETPRTVDSGEQPLDSFESDETVPPQKDFSLVEHLLALILLGGFFGLFSLLALGITQFFALFLPLNESLVKMIIYSLLTILFLTIFFIVNRTKLKRYLLKRKLDLIDLLTIIFGLIVIISFGILFAFVELGSFSWLPLNEWLPTLLAAFFYGVSEELVFRSILLVYLSFWLEKLFKDEQLSFRLSGIVVFLLFGLVWHIRYILSGEFLLLGFIILFSLASTVYTVERKKVVPFMILHVAMNFLIFLFVGGTITQL
jgi:membrane protease YdiL (CAAX protease family)